MRLKVRIRVSIACLAFVGLTGPPPAGATEPSLASPTSSFRFTEGQFNRVPADTTHLARYDFAAGPSCDAEGWTVVDRSPTGFGAYAGLAPTLTVVQQDPCLTMTSCVWGFFVGSDNNFACGGFPAQPTVPHGDGNGYFHNEIQSPRIDLTGTRSACEVAIRTYRDLDLDALVFYTLRVRSFMGETPGPWRDRGILYYGRDVDWLLQHESIADLIEPGATSLQIGIGVVDMCGQWCGVIGGGACHSHGPLIDEVWVYQVDSYGPQWFVETSDVFHDNFPADGTATGTVRMDTGHDINRRANPVIRPGDSLVVSVSEPTVGLDYDVSGNPASGPAVYLHVRDRDDGKSGAVISGDASRWPVVSTAGGWTTLRMDSARAGDGRAAADRYCVDLNDALYTPGDTVVYYMSARDASGRTTYWDDGVARRRGAETLSGRPYQARCLPNTAGSPRILFVDDSGADRRAAPFFDAAFDHLGIRYQVDRFEVRGAEGLTGDGLGSRVVDVEQQLVPFYNIIIWCTSDLSRGTIGDGSGRPEKSRDAQLLVEFLERQPLDGGLYLTGNSIASELDETDAAALLSRFIEYEVVTRDHTDYLPLSPVLRGAECGPFEDVLGPDSLVAFGGCPTIQHFDVLAPSGATEVAMHYNPTGDAAALMQETTNDLGARQRVLLEATSFELLRNYAPSSIPARTRHLFGALSWLRETTPVPTGVPRPAGLELSDDGVTITWSLVQARCESPFGVRLEHTIGADPNWSTIGPDTLLPPTGSYLDRMAVPGVRNHYRHVRVFDSSESPGFPQSITPPFQEKHFSASPAPTGVELRWDIPAHDWIRGVRLSRSDRPGGPAVSLLDSLAAPSGRYVDESAESGRSHCYYCAIVFKDDSAVMSGGIDVTPRIEFNVFQNAPNPFNPTTTITFVMPATGPVTITIYDIAGRRVATVLSETRPGGVNNVIWDGRDNNGNEVASGVFFYRVETGGQSLTRKMVVVR